jgi:Na+-driven multidrug efflux pump
MLQRFGGDLYVGVIAVVNALREVIFMPVSAMHNGATPIIGYNYGADKYDRVRRAIKFSASVTTVYATVIWAVIMLAPGMLIRVFSNEQELIAAGIPALRMYFALFVFMSLQMSAQCTFVGLGRSKNAIFFSLLRKVFVAAPLTVILPFVGMGTDGVFIAEAASQFIGGIACFGAMYVIVYRRIQNQCGTGAGSWL